MAAIRRRRRFARRSRRKLRGYGKRYRRMRRRYGRGRRLRRGGRKILRRGLGQNKQRTWLPEVRWGTCPTDGQLTGSLDGPILWKNQGFRQPVVTNSGSSTQKGFLSIAYLQALGKFWKWFRPTHLIISFRWRVWQGPASKLETDSQARFWWRPFKQNANDLDYEKLTSFAAAEQLGAKSMKLHHGQSWYLKFPLLSKYNVSMWTATSTSGADYRWQRPRWEDINTHSASTPATTAYDTDNISKIILFGGEFAISGLAEGDKVAMDVRLGYQVKGVVLPAMPGGDTVDNEINDDEGEEAPEYPPEALLDAEPEVGELPADEENKLL